LAGAAIVKAAGQAAALRGEKVRGDANHGADKNQVHPGIGPRAEGAEPLAEAGRAAKTRRASQNYFYNGIFSDYGEIAVWF